MARRDSRQAGRPVRRGREARSPAAERPARETGPMHRLTDSTVQLVAMLQARLDRLHKNRNPDVAEIASLLDRQLAQIRHEIGHSSDGETNRDED